MTKTLSPDDDFALIRGTGNVFADLGDADATTKRMKADLAAEIIATLDVRGLSARAGAKVAGVDGSDIQRIRNGDLARFTLDRLVKIAHRLGRSVELRVLPSSSDVAA